MKCQQTIFISSFLKKDCKAHAHFPILDDVIIHSFIIVRHFLQKKSAKFIASSFSNWNKYQKANTKSSKKKEKGLIRLIKVSMKNLK